MVSRYDAKRLSVATLASHTALQIAHGAKKEGLGTIVVGPRDRLSFYAEFGHLIDEFVEVSSWSSLCDEEVERRLRELNAIVIPHGSFVEYVGLSCAEQLEVPLFGLRPLFRVEAEQRRKMELLSSAGIPIPRIYEMGEELERPAIVKMPGAKGGRGYFLARSRAEVEEGLRRAVEEGLLRDASEALIQEYVVGVPAFFHFFRSVVRGRLELTGADIRYEANLDGLRRLPPSLAEGIEPSFVVVGNVPLTLRESLLPIVVEYGRRFVEATRALDPSGIVGPFCLESVITDELEIVVFEFSGRIVAGTNLYVAGSPYSWLYWDEPMSVGRRIAREIREAADRGTLEVVVS
ncbi:MAG: formate--phosphoribosylaminoimidazolecarboxamide ligase [Fervidicoccaceae archaeon]